MEIRKRPMQTAKFVVLFLIWSAKTKSSVTVKMLNSYKVVTKQKGVRIMRQYHETEKKEIQKLAKMYREFLDAGKTERECSSNICRIAKEQGFENLEDVIREGKQLKAGDKIYAENMKKSVIMMEIGTDDIENGMLLIGSHIDSPRLDIKQNPLYENGGMAYLDTHYYGGIKKYQWVASPMAIHGVIVKTDGTTVQINIGEKPEDPVFGVSDLLIHLAGTQMEKKGAKVIEGEDLNVLVGSMPLENADKETKETVKANILALLSEYYQIEEEDFLSAEIEVVPAGAARDYGFDRSMIMGYGHDDRVCAYPSFAAMLNVEIPERTSACLLVDKEEIGSVGATGMQSRFFENMTAEVMNACGNYSDLALRRCLENSRALSSDVSAAFDPNYPSVMEKKNSAYFGHGVVFNKYTGARGKSGSNDASAELMAKVIGIMEKEGVYWQIGELGAVDVGGGGTIAKFVASMNIDVVDLGVPILSMHAPFELASKLDVLNTYRAFKSFYKN